MNMDVNQVRLGESAENKKLYSKYNYVIVIEVQVDHGLRSFLMSFLLI